MASLESSPHASNHVSSHMIGAEKCLGNSCICVDLAKDVQVLEDITLVPDDLALEGVKAAAQHTCPSCLPESDTSQTMMTEISSLQITSICHIAKQVRPLLSEISALEFQQSVKSDLWGFVRLSLFAKAVLRPPRRGGKKKRHVVSACLLSCLQQWQAGDPVSLWIEARNNAICNIKVRKSFTLSQRNTRHVLFLASESRCGDAMRSLRSNGCDPANDLDSFEELKFCHPSQPLPEWSEDIPPPLCVNSLSVMEALQTFPRASSPGFSKLRSQHLLDATIGTTSPAGQEVLENLTRWVNFALSGKMDKRISAWLRAFH